LRDDATALCLDWYGPHPTGRRTGGDVSGVTPTPR
jgi:hypothetical protein